MSQVLSSPRMEMPLSISDGSVTLKVDPSLGGSFLEFSAKLGEQWVEIMRPTPETIKSSSDTSSFLMGPYPNRIRDGKFRFDGREYQLKFPEKHAIHGDVRNRPWKVERASSNSCTLAFRSQDFADLNYPFPFSMRQNFEVASGILKTGCIIRNEGSSPMPAGCGFHPYYNRALGEASENVMLQFSVAGTYPFTGDVPLPEGMAIPLKPDQDFTELRDLNVSLDHCFSGWRGPAVMFWPESNVRVTMQASANMSHLVLYSPPGKPFFAFEPQTQMNDGFNFHAQGIKDTGVVVLSPGEELSTWFTLAVTYG